MNIMLSFKKKKKKKKNKTKKGCQKKRKRMNKLGNESCSSTERNLHVELEKGQKKKERKQMR
jgi:hypothetical protein